MHHANQQSESLNTVVFQDYMDNVRGKEVSLLRTTVKIPGQRPRGSESKPTPQSNGQPATQGESFLNTCSLLDFVSLFRLLDILFFACH